MPAIITHDFFGRGLAEDARDLLGLRSTAERDAFLLGNQGPDPLFYLVVDPLMHKWSPLGDAMHDGSPAELLLAMREAAARLEGHERQVARAYVAGFACHWLLDSTMHPFVYFWQSGLTTAGVPGLDEEAASKVHAEVERDLDEMVLYTFTGKTVRQWRPHERVLIASRATLAAIDKLYFYVALWVFGRPIDPRTFSTAVHEFRLVQRVFDSPSGRKRAALGTVERLVTRSPFSLVNAMSHRARAEETSVFDNRDHRPWENPFTGAVDTMGFWDLFEGARSRALPALDELLLSEEFDLAAARELTHDLNFEGRPTEPGEKVAW
ncbi:hypothetical protein [Olsenella profusa]|uniref:Phospholipase C/D domain-containing protein n=1 Tax=Olsenella profusa TaxID=138595 RepID=A0ABS2F2U1_9ACTN|nr:hypothetical protein [Olsenella profusa]MBM6775311.1 hypothetical protein [Olsenella profusa]